MKERKKFSVHPRIQISLAAGASILILAYFSKKILPEPLSYLELALPPFLATIFEAMTKNRKAAWYSRPLVGVMAILVCTALVIWLNS